MKPIPRRTFLRGAGVGLALPLLEAMIPASARAAGSGPAGSPKRFVAMNIPLSFIPANFFPTDAGENYTLSPYLKLAEPLRKDFTVISGVSHPGVDGGHSAEKSFLTAAPHPGSRSFQNTLSLDQYMAQRIGDATRFASLTLGERSLSWSANGVSIPNERYPAKSFAKLFLTGTPQEVAAQKRELEDGHSILDTVNEDAQAMQPHISTADRRKLDQFFTAVRETEKRLVKTQSWSNTPKPKVNARPPGKFEDADMIGYLRAHFDVMRLALETDSTRVIALNGFDFGTVPKIKGVDLGYHTLSHHGMNPAMLKQLEVIERAQLSAIIDFLNALKSSADGGETLLDNTQVFIGSNLGSASGHLTTNLPVLLAGGGYRHGKHLAFDKLNNYPLANLFVTMLQRMGLETHNFASGNGTMRGLEMV
ncbi:MAG TPA: DUF1552 domain-containing protein [Tepidisphaeraceae bacterium]|jgi:hypothetical protein|nr:DUF1552 domain-containing protein [Tepidisphaeraceae bacterium]